MYIYTVFTKINLSCLCNYSLKLVQILSSTSAPFCRKLSTESPSPPDSTLAQGPALTHSANLPFFPSCICMCGMPVWKWVLACVHTCVCKCACGGPRLTLAVFLSCSPYAWRQGVSVESRACGYGYEFVLTSPCFYLPWAKIIDMSPDTPGIYMCSGNESKIWSLHLYGKCCNPWAISLTHCFCSQDLNTFSSFCVLK